MADPAKQPLLSAEDRLDSSSRQSDGTRELSENTPLLSSSAATPRYDGEQDELVTPPAYSPEPSQSIRSFWSDGSSGPRRSAASSIKPADSKGSRWPSIIAMILLALLSITTLLVAFFVPAAVEEYAKQAAVLEPTNLSLESITSNGVRVRIQADFRLDATRVQNEHTRRVGKAATWIVRQLGTEETRVNVTLPDYDNILLGMAAVPPLAINIVEGQNTAIDFVAELTPGNTDGVRMIANQWLEGNLEALQLKGQANIQLKSGVIPLGTHSIVESLTFEGQYLYRSFASLYFGEKTLL